MEALGNPTYTDLRDPEMLTRLYRLDHVATRLRRSADSLLVVSGTIEQVVSGEPMVTAMSTILQIQLESLILAQNER